MARLPGDVRPKWEASPPDRLDRKENVMQSLLERTNSFDPAERLSALRDLVRKAGNYPAVTDWLNMHMHTFFSFNGEGWSPTRIAWEARQRGLYALAICDFDVLQGLEELLAAGDLLGIRSAVGFESRTFFSEYAEHEINSPGEPGVFYFMGMGFVSLPPVGSSAKAIFDDMLERSHERNRALIERVNRQLPEIALDYDEDVLPLTPAGNATERHIVRAYHEKALERFAGNVPMAAVFWSPKLGISTADTEVLLNDVNAFNDKLRSKLMKKGGLGYEQPNEQTFPKLDDVIGMILECRAIPMSAWLDGTSSGEANPREQLELLMGKGVAAVNIIPDRNWNLKNPQEKERKIAELDRYVEVATVLDLPINVGTELNKPGQRFVDDFSVPAMSKHHAAFLHGAQVMVGQTRLLRWADFSYVDEKTVSAFPERKQRNAFFASVGALPPPAPEQIRKLNDMDSENAFSRLADAARNGKWG